MLIGFGTDRGTVTATAEWGGPPRTMRVTPSLPASWGAVLREVAARHFFLDLRAVPECLCQDLSVRWVERFIGVVYLSETELLNHYIESALAEEYDGYIWIEETRAVEPLTTEEMERLPQEHPFSA